jgi:hypothetical protein
LKKYFSENYSIPNDDGNYLLLLGNNSLQKKSGTNIRINHINDFIFKLFSNLPDGMKYLPLLNLVFCNGQIHSGGND